MLNGFKPHQTLPLINGRTYFVGDLHGCHSQLMQQLDEISFDFANDRLICVGDLIDRGPETISCIGLLHKPWFYSVLGNHEQMFVLGRTLKSQRYLHQGNGGDWMLDHPTEILDSLLLQLKILCPCLSSLKSTATNSVLFMLILTIFGVKPKSQVMKICCSGIPERPTEMNMFLA